MIKLSTFSAFCIFRNHVKCVASRAQGSLPELNRHHRLHKQGGETALRDFSTIIPPRPNFASNLLSIATAQLHKKDLQATKQADCYLHIYFNAFKQRIG
jgi:hypothetical protein